MIFINSSFTNAATSFQVQTAKFNIVLNGITMDNSRLPYPLITYKDITYFPMTWDFSKLMGLDLTYDVSSGLGITQGTANASQNLKLNTTQNSMANLSASVVTYPVKISGQVIQNGIETYPLLNIKGITYFPLTWRYAVTFFGWQYEYSISDGLRITPKTSQTTQTNTVQVPDTEPATESVVNSTPSTTYDSIQNIMPLISNELLPLQFNSVAEVPDTFLRDQGKASTCWAFAANSAFELAIYKKTGLILDFSEDHLISNAPIPVTYDSGGYFLIAGAYFSNGQGPILETEDPYRDGNTNTTAQPSYLMTEYINIENDLIGTKNAIYKYGSAVASINFNDDGYENYSSANHSYYNDDETLPPSHEFVLVGWDDNYPVSKFKVKPDKPGAFIAMNSWGSDWGENGYFYISYEDVNILDGVYAITDFETLDTNTEIYNYNPTGITRYEGYVGYNYATGLNQFKASKDESLYAVSFYIPMAYTQYEVSVDLKDDGIFKLTPEVSGYIGTTGYYTVYLPTPLSIKANQRFSIAVKLENDQTEFLLPIEAPYPNIGYRVTGNPGESFMTLDPIKYDFEDIIDHLDNGNLGIRAFAK